jgi:hypothetical protein
MNKRNHMSQPKFQSPLVFKPRVTIIFFFLLCTKKTRNGTGQQLFVQNDIIKEGDGIGH